MSELSYAVVIATRNRIDALAISIPLVLAQTRRPDRVIVVDKSDDHAAVAALCDELAERTSIPLTCVEPPRANLAHQRNVGLALVFEDVIMYPDDDAFWYPDTADEIMKVYEADVERLIGGVSGVQTDVSPVASEESIGVAASRLTNVPWILRTRRALEARFAPQPLYLYGSERTRELETAARRAGLDVPLIETMTGFRMSFRTAVARELGFDELLGSRSGYSSGEDRDVSARVLRSGRLLAAAQSARVFHNVYPSKRANGFTYGFFQVFNYLYICRNVLPRGGRPWAAARRYLNYRSALYGVGRSDAYMREVARGARAAFREFDFMMSAADEDLAFAYAEACERNLPRPAEIPATA